MKYLLPVLLLLTGCSIKGVNNTLFLKEDSSHIYNLKGEECSESGYTVDKDREDITEEHYALTTYYGNCDIHKVRRLEEFEPKQWGIKPGKNSPEHAGELR